MFNSEKHIIELIQSSEEEFTATILSPISGGIGKGKTEKEAFANLLDAIHRYKVTFETMASLALNESVSVNGVRFTNDSWVN